MDNKFVVFSISHIKIMTAQHLLKEAGIESNVIDRTDSAHAGIFGDIELYIPIDKQAEARTILIQAEILTE